VGIGMYGWGSRGSVDSGCPDGAELIRGHVRLRGEVARQLTSPVSDMNVPRRSGRLAILAVGLYRADA
jgi:hypothetical protein